MKNSKIQRTALALVALVFSLGYTTSAWSWTQLEPNIYISEGTNVRAVSAQDDGEIRVQFGDNTGPICNGNNFIQVGGVDTQASNRIYAVAMLAKALNLPVYANMVRIINGAGNTDCRIQVLYTQ